MSELPFPSRLGEAEFVGYFEDGSEEWHAQRATGIGSSEVASCAGVPGAFKSAFMLWQEKMGNFVPPEPEERVRRMFLMGHLAEPTLDSIAHEERPWELSFKAGSWRHVNDHTALLNPDRLVWDTKRQIWIGREYKNSRRGFENDEVPLKYVAQAEWCRGMMGLAEWQVGAIYGGSDWRWWTVMPAPFGMVAVRNDQTGETEMVQGVSYLELKSAHEWFVNLLRTGTPPPLDGSEDTYDLVRAQKTGINEKEDVQVPVELARDLHEHTNKMKHHKDEAMRLKSEATQAMGEAKGAFIKDEDGKDVRVFYRQAGPNGGAPSLRVSTSRKAKEALGLTK